MEESGNMSCGCGKSSSRLSTSVNLGNSYVAYKQASELFMNRFSLSQLDFDISREDLIPYYIATLNYLNYRLTILGTDDIKTMLCEVFDIFDEGTDAICQEYDYSVLLSDILEKEDYKAIDGKLLYIIKESKEGGSHDHIEVADELYTKFQEYLEENSLTEPTVDNDEIYEMNATEWAQHIGIEISDCGADHDRFVFAWSHAMSTICMRLKFQYAHLFDQEESDSDCCSCTRGETTDDYESWVSNVYSNDEEYDRTNYTRANSSWQISKSRICDCYRRQSGTSTAEDNDEDGENVSLS